MQFPLSVIKVLITGANGFIGSNLQLYLSDRRDVQIVSFTREHKITQLPELLIGIDFVFHFAGVNRTSDSDEFLLGNTNLTKALCHALRDAAVTTGKKIPLVFSSSSQATSDSPYGQSKRAAEVLLFDLQRNHDFPIYIFRLPNVFGKWCKPNYNSFIATFCHNIARDMPIQINDPNAPVRLTYVDDVLRCFVLLIDGADAVVDCDGFVVLAPQYSSTVGELARLIQSFKESRSTLITGRVGLGLTRALYATYVSYLPPECFSYKVPQHNDGRGVFVEMLKTPDCGQFSYFTARPGKTRGGHYHHTKTEKFLVIKGRARFRFRHMKTSETRELFTSDATAEIVETIPGWTHDITNVGDVEMVVMLWANELFNRDMPDTYTSPL